MADSGRYDPLLVGIAGPLALGWLKVYRGAEVREQMLIGIEDRDFHLHDAARAIAHGNDFAQPPLITSIRHRIDRDFGRLPLFQLPRGNLPSRRYRLPIVRGSLSVATEPRPEASPMPPGMIVSPTSASFVTTVPAKGAYTFRFAIASSASRTCACATVDVRRHRIGAGRRGMKFGLGRFAAPLACRPSCRTATAHAQIAFPLRGLSL